MKAGLFGLLLAMAMVIVMVLSASKDEEQQKRWETCKETFFKIRSEAPTSDADKDPKYLRDCNPKLVGNVGAGAQISSTSLRLNTTLIGAMIGQLPEQYMQAVLKAHQMVSTLPKEGFVEGTIVGLKTAMNVSVQLNTSTSDIRIVMNPLNASTRGEVEIRLFFQFTNRTRMNPICYQQKYFVANPTYYMKFKFNNACMQQ